MAFSTHIKQSATNQLRFPITFNPADYDLLTFSFYQNGDCIATYNSAQDEYVDLSNDKEVRIYMLPFVSKRFGPQRVSFEATAFSNGENLLLVSHDLSVELCRSNERPSVVDEDDSEITDNRIRAYLERIAYKYLPSSAEAATTYLQQEIEALQARVEELESLPVAGNLNMDDNGVVYINTEEGDNS